MAVAHSARSLLAAPGGERGAWGLTIAGVESLHADAGWRTYDFLKITTERGLVGWSEYNESSAGTASPP